MTSPLKVIALISGGKDSIYSILHCLRNGHHIVALGNLYPPSPSGADVDLNSFMYQTVGHSIIPLYSQALALPLYRQPIHGTAIQSGTSYAPPRSATEVDETESLMPLLQRIMAAHPDANAVSTGAILSTYQRTRVESVAVRLGLVPLSYLWQYPSFNPSQPTVLLRDMQRVGLQARIVKVASGGLDESFLWEDVVSERGMRRVERAVGRFATAGDGAVLGEGGEFETMVVDGPEKLFRGRIVVEDEERWVVREEGGVAWLRIGEARVEMKSQMDLEGDELPRVPDLLELRFLETLKLLGDQVRHDEVSETSSVEASETNKQFDPLSTDFRFQSSIEGDCGYRWTIIAKNSPNRTVEREMEDIVDQIRDILSFRRLDVSEVNSTVVLLRSMKDFAAINKVYGGLFNELNPPARVTISCGHVLPIGCNIIVHLNISEKTTAQHSRKALHVQSRSYWAPANIGPYSQAHSVPYTREFDSDLVTNKVFIAGQIPLVPATMALPANQSQEPPARDCSKMRSLSDFEMQTVLSLQHLWRIGKEMDVSWWAGAVAYLSRDTISNIQLKARLAGAAWIYQHSPPVSDLDDDEDRDLWDEQHRHGQESRGSAKEAKQLPHWPMVDLKSSSAVSIPPLFAAEVEELPRGSEIEWHALLGVTSGPIQTLSHAIADIGSIHKCIVGGTMIFATVNIPYTAELRPQDLLNRLHTLIEATNAPQSLTAAGTVINYHQPYTSYRDVCVRGLWQESSSAGIVPCRSLWDEHGKRLAAVYCYSDRSTS